MAFSSTQLHLLTKEQFNTRLFEVIGNAEGFLSTPTNIGDGVVTIGYEYNLNAHSNNLQTFISQESH